VFVKICGITTVEDARVAADAGADAVGFNLWPRSKRYRPLDAFRAAAEAVAGRVERFGVFVDPGVEEVEAAFAAGVIDVAQLHGDETPEFCARFAGRVVKALRLAGAHSLAAITDHAGRGDRVLVDAPFAGYGGSGQLVDEALAAEACRRGARVILAGGLTPDNVAAVAARVRPFGVDVASGVEHAPGVKDPDRIRRFVVAAKQVNPNDYRPS
jgi:phosphoribosylanthranilate isomerase